MPLTMKMRSFAAICCFGLARKGASMTAFLGTNSSCQRSSMNPLNTVGPYGKGSCPCVGIDNLKGYYATQQDAYHVQYKAEAGSTCETWDMGMHPECRGGYYEVPSWCRQSWCYVDPCNCHLDVLPKMTNAGIEYQGSPAYWSYDTCGGVDTYSQEMNPDACVMQKTAAACTAKSECAWNGQTCGGKEVMNTCKGAAKKDASIYGQEDCRCIGVGGRHPGKAFMYINEQKLTRYSPNVGATCEAWEMESHPECVKDGEKPAWCHLKWCFVDPCKCKTKVPPKVVMGPNQVMRFQGKVAYWSAETCGNSLASSSSSTSLDEAMQQTCAEQERSGQLPSAALSLKPASFVVVLAAVTAVVAK